MIYKYIEVIKYDTFEVVKRIDVTGHSERIVAKAEIGLNINLNHSDYYTEVKETTTKLDPI